MNKVEIQGKLARDCNVKVTKRGGKMCFMTVQATREGGSDFVPVKAFEVPETLIPALGKGVDVYVRGRLQIGRYDKELGRQLYDNVVIADEIVCANGSWKASAVTTAAALSAPVPAVS